MKHNFFLFFLVFRYLPWREGRKKERGGIMWHRGGNSARPRLHPTKSEEENSNMHIFLPYAHTRAHGRAGETKRKEEFSITRKDMTAATGTKNSLFPLAHSICLLLLLPGFCWLFLICICRFVWCAPMRSKVGEKKGGRGGDFLSLQECPCKE